MPLAANDGSLLNLAEKLVVDGKVTFALGTIRDRREAPPWSSRFDTERAPHVQSLTIT